MAPKIKITSDSIVKTAVDLVRREGCDALNARAIAAELGCSTQPIFSNFATMEKLQEATVDFSYEIYLGYLKSEAERGIYPEYKSFGMAYIRFAKEEKELFKLLFMCDRSGTAPTPTTDFNASVEIIMATNKISREKAELMHLEMWSCVHGIGTMLATSYISLDEELISNMLSDVYHGIRVRHVSEEA